MKYRAITVAAIAAGVLVATTACGSGSTGSTGTGSSSAPKTTAAAAKTYTAAELPAILQTASKSLGVTGTVLDNEQVQAKAKQATGSNGITALFSQPGITLTPAACKDIITKNLSATPPAGTASSLLSFGSSVVSVSTISGKQVPTSTTADSESKIDQALGSCGSMKLTLSKGGQTVSIPLTIKKTNVTSNADKTYGFVETVTVPGATSGSSRPVTVQIVTAVAGNLVIMTEQASGTTTATAGAAPAPSDVINAVIAAAKK